MGEGLAPGTSARRASQGISPSGIDRLWTARRVSLVSYLEANAGPLCIGRVREGGELGTANMVQSFFRASLGPWGGSAWQKSCPSVARRISKLLSGSLAHLLLRQKKTGRLSVSDALPRLLHFCCKILTSLLLSSLYSNHFVTHSFSHTLQASARCSHPHSSLPPTVQTLPHCAGLFFRLPAACLPIIFTPFRPAVPSPPRRRCDLQTETQQQPHYFIQPNDGQLFFLFDFF